MALVPLNSNPTLRKQFHLAHQEMCDARDTVRSEHPPAAGSAPNARDTLKAIIATRGASEELAALMGRLEHKPDNEWTADDFDAVANRIAAALE